MVADIAVPLRSGPTLILLSRISCTKFSGESARTMKYSSSLYSGMITRNGLMIAAALLSPAFPWLMKAW